VADVPAVVADTHALLFHAAGGGQLGRRAAATDACERRQAMVFVPVASSGCSCWHAQRINLRRTVGAFFGFFHNPAYQPHDLRRLRCSLRTNTHQSRSLRRLIRAAAIDLELRSDARCRHSCVGPCTRHMVIWRVGGIGARRPQSRFLIAGTAHARTAARRRRRGHFH
jgi:hypothetical protein